MAVRELEGLERRSGLLAGEDPPDLVEIAEGPARLLVDVRGGQKTGMFLDQRRNRAAAAGYAEGARVLNCFAYSGAFGVHAGLGGAAEVTNADISLAACELAERNMALNSLQDRHEALEANCFDLLREWSDHGDRFDLVILDPPAFTKSRSAVEGALRGYKEINLRALRLLRPGGTLVTCSCSQHIDDATFKAMLLDAARDARREVRLLEQRGQGPDHPVLLRAPETPVSDLPDRGGGIAAHPCAAPQGGTWKVWRDGRRPSPSPNTLPQRGAPGAPLRWRSTPPLPGMPRSKRAIEPSSVGVIRWLVGWQ